MKIFNYCLAMLFCIFSLNLVAQNNNVTQVHKHKFSLYGGVGPNYYFNNLVIAKNYVQPLNYSVSARLMWEPEHFISLGIESGYYQLYAVKYTAPSLWTAQVVNTAVPIQLVMSMKFLRNFYADLSIGQTNLVSKFSSPEKARVEYSTWSLADYGITLGYQHPINDHFSFGIESKFFHSTKNDDRNLALMLVAAFHF